jgi:hypothetical protein
MLAGSPGFNLIAAKFFAPVLISLTVSSAWSTTSIG